MKAAPTASVSVKRPNLLAAVLGDVFKPFAGTAPNAPTPESPLSWMMLAAARRQLSGAAVNLDPPSPITVSPALIVNGNTITPAYPVTLTGIYNMDTAPPGVNQSIQGYQQFNVVDANGKHWDLLCLRVLRSVSHRSPARHLAAARYSMSTLV